MRNRLSGRAKHAKKVAVGKVEEFVILVRYIHYLLNYLDIHYDLKNFSAANLYLWNSPYC